MNRRSLRDPKDERPDEPPCVDDYGRNGTPLDETPWWDYQEDYE